MGKQTYDNYYHYNRNYGCRYREVTYKGYRTLILENEKLRIMILVDKGTDIIELLYKPKDIDFMWQSPIDVQAQSRNSLSKELAGGPFLDVYEGGWQELLPSITAPTNYKQMGLGIHGEVYLLPWEYQIVVDDPYQVKIKCTVRMRRSPLFVTKYITIRSESSVLEFDETIENIGDEEFQFMWGHHPAIGKPFLDEDCVIDLPAHAKGQIYQADFSGNSPFEPDTEYDWPNAPDKNGNMVDISRPMPPESKTAFNTYIKDLKDGWFGITNLKKGVGIGMQWDINVFKYMLMWAVYRGYYDFPAYGRTYNLALEFYSAIPDCLDEVIALGRGLKLMPGEKLNTSFQTIVYESDRRICGFDGNLDPIKIPLQGDQ